MNVKFDSITNNFEIGEIACFTTSSVFSKALQISQRTYSEILLMMRWVCVDEVLDMVALVVLGSEKAS
jgi:hypothetical protein